jgi:membrane protease YdiL (CAAX protease family)
VRDIIWIVITPAALMTGALIGTYRNRLDPRTDLGLQLPSVRHAVIFSAVFVALMAAHESLYLLLGLSQHSDWRRYAPAVLAVRVVFAAFLYPVAEEFFFRGFLLGLITRKAGALAGIVATAVLFTALHGLQGPWIGGLQILADGLFFGFVRLRSGSLLLPMGFHVVGNSIAVLQRLY